MAHGSWLMAHGSWLMVFLGVYNVHTLRKQKHRIIKMHIYCTTEHLVYT